MNIYFSGIGGAGLSALAHLALDLGYKVFGSDKESNINTKLLQKRGASIVFEQNFEELEKSYLKHKFDWVIGTSGMDIGHAYFQVAKKYGFKITKRHEFINFVLQEKNLKLIALAGTHGKTTTTAMTVHLFRQLEIPVSYLIGSNVTFGNSGHYQQESEYFVYECDEFDRNFLYFQPFVSVISSLDYDHPDTYATKKDYKHAFEQFVNQNKTDVYCYQETQLTSPKIVFIDQKLETKLVGIHNRKNAQLVIECVKNLVETNQNLATLMNSFEGTSRRFEKLRVNLYSDYGHHPVEIEATLQLGSEILEPKQELILIYQPHQNLRQHEKSVQIGYQTCFNLATKIYWLPTFLSREDSRLEILTPAKILELSKLENNSNIQIIKLEDVSKIIAENRNNLVLCMGAGSIDLVTRKSIT
jgi:UDP-N-acetylmuramate--alanine ligase